jgi:alkylation response protein AidB-like acyl-CoA dehydrogenase
MLNYSNLSTMNFEISREQEHFLKKVDAICKLIRPYEEECYLKERFNKRIISEFSKIGMLGCPIARKYGGLGYDILTYALAIERLGEEGNSLRTFFSAHISIGQMVLEGWGNQEQRERYLPYTSTGKSIMAFALTEPTAGSDPSSLATTYEERGDHFVINGKKHWIGNGTIADLMTTYAKESGSINSNKNISAFIIDTDSQGIQIKEMKNKIGMLTVKNAEISFHNCIVPKKNLLGQKGQGLNIAYSALIDGRLSVAAGAIGVMVDCLHESISHAKSRVQHGSFLAKKQLIQRHIAKIILNIESSRWLVYRAAFIRQKLHNYVEELKTKDDDWQLKLTRNNKEYSVLRAEADNLSAVAKFSASNAAFDTSNIAVQIFGSFAYRKTNRVARHFLDSRAITVYEGANEVLELKIASHVLGERYRAY